MKQDIKSMLPDEISLWIFQIGEPKYKAMQIFKWLSRGIRGFDEMTDVSRDLRQRLDESYYITAPKLLKKQVSAEDGTIKYLWQLRDGNAVETVLMRYKHGNSLCISSQVGCRMGCAFCASTKGGKIRDLASSEMLDQVGFSEKDSGLAISNIVLMGIGEPLDNFDAVTRFLRLVNHPDGFNIGMRHISLSTCGLIEKVDKLGDYNLQLTLSVSLHAPDDETRSRLMPINRAYGIDNLFAACERYFKKTGRRISFEYAMIDGVNDTKRQAELLARRALKIGAHVNLIPLNDIENSPYKPSGSESIRQFMNILEEKGVNVTLRRRLGGDIDAACGQLRSRT